VEDANSKIVYPRGLGVDLVVVIPGSEVAGHRRGARIGRQQWRALSSSCGGRWLEYVIARVDEAGTRGRLPRWWHGRSARRLVGDAVVAQGAKATVERDGDCGAHDGEKVFCFTRLGRGRDKGNRVRRACGAAGGKWSMTGWKPRAAEWSGHLRGVEEEYLGQVGLGPVTSSGGRYCSWWAGPS
jgi:hypothetical protein